MPCTAGSAGFGIGRAPLRCGVVTPHRSQSARISCSRGGPSTTIAPPYPGMPPRSGGEKCEGRSEAACSDLSAAVVTPPPKWDNAPGLRAGRGETGPTATPVGDPACVKGKQPLPPRLFTATPPLSWDDASPTASSASPPPLVLSTPPPPPWDDASPEGGQGPEPPSDAASGTAPGVASAELDPAGFEAPPPSGAGAPTASRAAPGAGAWTLRGNSALVAAFLEGITAPGARRGSGRSTENVAVGSAAREPAARGVAAVEGGWR